MHKRLFPTLLLSLTLGACSHPSVPELRIGINPWPGNDFLYLAQELSLFDSTIVRVRVLEFTSLSDTRRAYERGQLAGFAGTVTEVLQARDHSGRRPVITLITDFSDGADVIVARAGIRDVRALHGHRVGAEFGSLNMYVLARALERQGEGLGDVTLANLDQVQMRDAFKKGKVDAVVTYPPVSVELLGIPGSHVLFSSREIPGEVVDVIALDSTVIDRHPAAVAELVRGFDRARLFAQDHPDLAYPRMAAREGMSTAEFRAALHEGVQVVDLAGQDAFLRVGGTIESVARRTAEVMMETGQLTRRPVLDRLSWRYSASVRSTERTRPEDRQP